MNRIRLVMILIFVYVISSFSEGLIRMEYGGYFRQYYEHQILLKSDDFKLSVIQLSNSFSKDIYLDGIKAISGNLPISMLGFGCEKMIENFSDDSVIKKVLMNSFALLFGPFYITNFDFAYKFNNWLRFRIGTRGDYFFFNNAESNKRYSIGTIGSLDFYVWKQVSLSLGVAYALVGAREGIMDPMISLTYLW